MSTRSAAKWVRGMTLVEVMVAAFLGSLVLYVLISTLIPAFKASATGSIRVSLDQRGTLTTARLIRALKSTSRAGLMAETRNGQTVLSVHPLEGILADSKPKWADHLVAFRFQDKTLQESLVPLTPPLFKATVLPFDDLIARAAQPRFYVNRVEEFSAVLGEGPRLDFKLVLKDGKDTLSIARTVFLANSSQ